MTSLSEKIINEQGIVLCDNCENMASKELSNNLGWYACYPCATGESATYEEQINKGDIIQTRGIIKNSRYNFYKKIK